MVYYLTTMEKELSLLGESKTKLITLLGEGEKSGQELARLMGINTTAIREHTDTLGRLGLVSSRFVHLGVGRPKKMYRLTPAGIELLPKHYDELLNLLLRKIHDKGGNILLSQLISDVVREFKSECDECQSETLEKRIENAVNFLNKLGFMATVERDGGKTFVVRHNCIFNKTAKLYSGILCSECDTSFVKEPIGSSNIELISCIGKGDTSCRNLIKS